MQETWKMRHKRSLGWEDLLEESVETHSCLENPMDREAWWATVHRVAKSQTWLKWLSMHTWFFFFIFCYSFKFSTFWEVYSGSFSNWQTLLLSLIGYTIIPLHFYCHKIVWFLYILFATLSNETIFIVPSTFSHVFDSLFYIFTHF